MSAEEHNIQNDDGKDFQDTEEIKYRVSTDGNYFLLHFIFLCGLGGFLTYCIYNGDLDRILVGYDNCHNICGRQNFVLDGHRISDMEGFDMRARPYLLVFRPDGRNTYNVTHLTGLRSWDSGVVRSLSRDTARVCLSNCEVYPNYEPYKFKCILKKMKGVSDRFFGKTGIPNFLLEVAEDIATSWKKILYLEVGCCVLSLVITILLGLFVEAMVWLLLHIAVLVCLAFTIYMWFLFGESAQTIFITDYLPSTQELERNGAYISFAIIGIFISFYLIFYILSKKKEMQLVVELYKEAMKPLKAMRLIFILPLVTCIFVSGVIAAWVYTDLWIESSGNLINPKPEYFQYEKDFWNSAARWYNIIAFLWMIFFILDCQHMAIVGAVSFWYFCRTKNDLGFPIFYGFYNLLGHHLGSVSLGSFITMMIGIPRFILMLMQKLFQIINNGSIPIFCLNFLHWWEMFLKCLTRDAYIEVAIHGYSFRSAGRRVSTILTTKNLDITSVKEMGNFVLIFAKVFICTTASLIGAIILQEEEDLLHIWVVIILIGLFSYLICSCFFSLYQSTIDTIFLCFCEDYDYHDGISKPYLMTTEFLEFIKKSTTLVIDSETLKTQSLDHT